MDISAKNGQNFFRPKRFWWSSRSYGDTTSCKKNRTVKAVGPERTYERTNGRTRESEFIGSLLDKSGKPKRANLGGGNPPGGGQMRSF